MVIFWISNSLRVHLARVCVRCPQILYQMQKEHGLICSRFFSVLDSKLFSSSRAQKHSGPWSGPSGTLRIPSGCRVPPTANGCRTLGILCPAARTPPGPPGCSDAVESVGFLFEFPSGQRRRFFFVSCSWVLLFFFLWDRSFLLRHAPRLTSLKSKKLDQKDRSCRAVTQPVAQSHEPKTWVLKWSGCCYSIQADTPSQLIRRAQRM